METNNQNSKIEGVLPLGTLFYKDHHGEIKKCRYDLSLVAEFFDEEIGPKEFSETLREIHHWYATGLIEDFIESQSAGSKKEVNYNFCTLDRLYEIKDFADQLDEVETTETVEPAEVA
jgi:hypothetical protein